MVLAVEDQAGDEVAAEADELALGGVVAIEGVFVGLPVTGVAAIATGNATSDASAEVCGADVIGVAGAVDAEVRSVSVGSGEGGRGGAGEEGGSGEGFEGHGVRGV